VQLGFEDGGTGKQFGSRLEPPVDEKQLNELMLLIRNTLVEVLNEEA
jgi:hypothetical protein